MGSRLEFRALPYRLAGVAMAAPRLSGVATAPGGSSPWSNMPAGMTIVGDANFNTGTPATWPSVGTLDTDWMYADNPQFVQPSYTAIVADASSPTGQDVLEARYYNGIWGSGYSPVIRVRPQDGHGTAGAPALDATGANNWQEAYLGVHFFVPATWDFYPQNVNKIAFFAETTNWTNFYLWFTDWTGVNNGISTPQYCVYWFSMGYNGSTSESLGPNLNVSSAPLTLGAWNKIEAYCKLSSGSGIYDGIARMWINGVHVMEYTAVGAANTEFTGAITDGYIEPIWGGATGLTKNVAPYDYLRFAGARIAMR